MKLVTIIDTETSSLDPKTGELLEVGAALWSVTHRSLVHASSWLFRAERNDAQAVNGIPLVMAQEFGQQTFPRGLVEWAAASDAVLAHNAAFDRQWLPQVEGRWICTCDDIEWPEPTTSRSLTAIALAHGVGVVDAHRALADVLTLVRLLEAVSKRGHDVAAMLERGLRPKGTFKALVSYDDREQAKAAGFRWDAPSKSWLRTMALDDAGRLPFRTVRTDKENAA